MNLTGRRVAMFRTLFDPSIGPMPKQAFNLKDSKMEGEMTSVGIYVKTSQGFEHVVPWSNIQSVKLEPESITTTTK